MTQAEEASTSQVTWSRTAGSSALRTALTPCTRFARTTLYTPHLLLQLLPHVVQQALLHRQAVAGGGGLRPVLRGLRLGSAYHVEPSFGPTGETGGNLN